MQALDEIDDMLMAPQVSDLNDIDTLLRRNNSNNNGNGRGRGAGGGGGDQYDAIADRLGLQNWESGM